MWGMGVGCRVDRYRGLLVFVCPPEDDLHLRNYMIGQAFYSQNLASCHDFRKDLPPILAILYNDSLRLTFSTTRSLLTSR